MSFSDRSSAGHRSRGGYFRLWNPEDYCRFIHLDGFTQDWSDLRLTDDDLSALQIEIMLNPLDAPVISGTGGVRKLRFAPQSRSAGKSGGARVLYAVFPKHSVAVLAAVYSKRQQQSIGPDEKKSLKRILGEIASILDGGTG